MKYVDKVMLVMLVQYCSGIFNYINMFNYWMALKGINEENLEFVFDLFVSFEFGISYEYSNINYLLLGELMDKVLGYFYFQFIQKVILN